MKLLDGGNVYTSFYTDDEGKKNKFFEIKKKFDGKPKNKAGNTILFVWKGKYTQTKNGPVCKRNLRESMIWLLHLELM